MIELNQEQLQVLERDLERDARRGTRSGGTSSLSPQMIRSAPSRFRRSSARRHAAVGFRLGSRSNASISLDFLLLARRSGLDLDRHRAHQRLQRARILLEARDELVALGGLRKNDLAREPLDRDVGGVEDVAVRVDHAIDLRRRRGRFGLGRERKRGRAGGQCRRPRDEITTMHDAPLPAGPDARPTGPDRR